MKPLSGSDLLRLADRCLGMTHADQVEVLASSTDSALTRFAGNRIHQNVAERDLTVSVRAVMGTRVGVASTNRMDDEGLAACAADAVAAAHIAPEDPDFPGLPASPAPPQADRVSPRTEAFDADARAEAARAMIEQSSSRGLVAAGTVSASSGSIAVVNSVGTRAAMVATDVHASVLSMGDEGGSGWAEFTGRDASKLAADALGDEAASLAQRSTDPISLAAGDYVVVLAAAAVAELIDMLAYASFSARSVEEGRSFMSGHTGEKLLSERITITDDALAEDALGLTFDFEGVPKQRTKLVEKGVVVGPVTDSYWAARTGRPNTGHALPAPNSFGPYPLDLRLAAGDASVEEMIASVGSGVYVTRFHYVNVEDPVRAILTGMTRDGTFLIESGKLTRPVKNLRFTQSAVEALAGVLAVGKERRFAGDEGQPPLVPALLLERFAFTGQTR
jgi:PmbA protein